MDIFVTVVVCIIAGAAAGLGTGFAGMSAAVAISPMLITFLDMDAYEAVGIALASDILASAISAWTYYKNKNLDIKLGIVMLMPVLAFTALASYIASFFKASTMGNVSIIMSMLLGVKFLLFPDNETKESMEAHDRQQQISLALATGVVIGSICGFMGAGGGMMLLLALTTVLGCEIKTSVGTSVFIMTFTALTGAGSHFYIGGTPNPLCLVVCALSTYVFAQVAAIIANHTESAKLNRMAGLNLVIIGAVILVVKLF